MNKNTILVLLLLPILFHVNDSNAKGKILYTTGSLTNVRDKPSANGKLVLKLRINSKVYVLEEKQEWVKVDNYSDSGLGWIHKSLLSRQPLELKKVLASSDDIKNTPKQRRQLMERAAALDPLNKDVLEKLEKSYLDEGNTVKAEELKKYRLNLTKPILPENKIMDPNLF